MATTVVASKKVKRIVKELGLRMSPAVPDALDARVRSIIEAAAKLATTRKERILKVADLTGEPVVE